jgi:8-oxo-dGTP pyrophosphatase MutT (NUDIX family)
MPAKFYIGVKAVIIHQQKLLVLNRAHSASGAFPDLPGGRMEAGESIEAALRRELAEELPGMPEFEIGEILLARRRAQPFLDGTEFCLLYFRVTVPEFEIRLSEEHSGYEWMGRAEIDQLEKPYREVYSRLLNK